MSAPGAFRRATVKCSRLWAGPHRASAVNGRVTKCQRNSRATVEFVLRNPPQVPELPLRPSSSFVRPGSSHTGMTILVRGQIRSVASHRAGSRLDTIERQGRLDSWADRTGCGFPCCGSTLVAPSTGETKITSGRSHWWIPSQRRSAGGLEPPAETKRAKHW